MSAPPIIRNVLLGVAVTAVVVWLVFDALPDVFAPERSPGFGPVAVEDARRGVRTAALQLLAGVVLAAGAVFTARTRWSGSRAIPRATTRRSWTC